MKCYYPKAARVNKNLILLFIANSLHMKGFPSCTSPLPEFQGLLGQDLPSTVLCLISKEPFGWRVFVSRPQN